MGIDNAMRLALSAAVVWGGALGAEAHASVCPDGAEGYVKRLSGAAEIIRTDGSRAPAALFSQLCARDEIVVSSGVVEIQLPSDEPMTLGQGSRVRARDEPGDYAQYADLLTQLETIAARTPSGAVAPSVGPAPTDAAAPAVTDVTPEAAVIAAPASPSDAATPSAAQLSYRTRNQLQVRIPGLSTGEARVFAGRETITLEWSGGVLPMVVSVFAPNRVATGAREEDSDRTEIGFDLVPGDHEILLFDGDQNTSQLSFIAEAPRPAPATPAIDGLLEAMTLVREAPAVWSYEAYLRFVDAASDSPQAEALVEALVDGVSFAPLERTASLGLVEY